MRTSHHEQLHIHLTVETPMSGVLPSALSLHFYRGERRQLLQTIELEPFPDPLRQLAPDLAVAFGIGVAANYHRSVPECQALTLSLAESIHPAWCEIAATYSRLAGIKLQIDCATRARKIALPEGAVFLVSGGKDTLYALEEQQIAGNSPAGYHGVYLGKGSEMNWRAELPQVHRIASHYALKLHHFRLIQSPISAKGMLRFGNRAVWRELVTPTLARGFGNRIYTGINNDAISQLKVTGYHYADFLGQLQPTLSALEQILEAHITTVPGEFEVYRAIRQHPLYDRAGSCLRSDCGRPDLCAKCRTFQIYDKVLDGHSLTHEDLRFIHGDHYLGDAFLLQQYA